MKSNVHLLKAHVLPCSAIHDAGFPEKSKVDQVNLNAIQNSDKKGPQ